MFKRFAWRYCLCALMASLMVGTIPIGNADSRKQETASFKSYLRRPAALVLAEDGRWLFVANQRAGSVSVIDSEAGRVVNELNVGRKLSDLVAVADGHLLAVDEEANELILLPRQAKSLSI